MLALVPSTNSAYVTDLYANLCVEYRYAGPINVFQVRK
jgi:hypothetical protein